MQAERGQVIQGPFDGSWTVWGQGDVWSTGKYEGWPKKIGLGFGVLTSIGRWQGWISLQGRAYDDGLYG